MSISAVSKQHKQRTPVAAFSDEAEAATDVEVTSETLQAAGEAFAAAGELTKALTRFDGALRLLPPGMSTVREATLHEHRSQILLSLDRSFDAISAAEQAILLLPAWAAAWLSLGRAQLNLGEAAMATKSLARCLELDPSCAESHDDLDRATAMELKLSKLNEDGRAASRRSSSEAQLAEVCTAHPVKRRLLRGPTR